MSATSLDVLGQQLHDFLTAQFQAPPGSTTVFAFLPAGIGVDPTSFYVGGQANPALVQEWLGIVADPLAEIVDGTAAAAPVHASTVMQAIAIWASPTAPIGSEAANAIGRLKNLANAATTPASDVVNAAPLDWYDPSGVPSWPTYTTNASAPPPPSGPDGGGQPNQIPIDIPPIWTWRHLRVGGPIPLEPDPVDGGTTPWTRLGGGSSGGSVRLAKFARAESVPTRTRHVAMSAGLLAASEHELTVPVVAASQTDDSTATVERAVPEFSVAAAVAADTLDTTGPSPLVDAVSPVNIGLLRGSASKVLLDRNWLSAQDQVAAGADTAPVAAPSLTLSLRYLFVQLDRSAWWSDLLVAAPGWCFAGQRAGSLLPGSLPADTKIGMPVALVLTDQVSVTGTWTDADKAAAADSTHFGPWQLSPGDDSSGSASLQIPGMQAIAVIYQVLPVLPPADDPALPTPAPEDPPPPPAPDTGSDPTSSPPPPSGGAAGAPTSGTDDGASS